MSAQKYDLLIVFDEEKDQLLFYRAPPRGAARKGGPLTERPAFTLQISALREKEANEAERLVGAGVFLFFEHHSDRKIGIRNYEDHTTNLAEETIHRLEKMSTEVHSSDHKFHLAMAYYDRGVGRRRWSDVEKAEMLLRQAASDGLDKAKEFLKEHWDRMRASAERMMKG